MLNIRVCTPYIQINKKTIQTFQKTDVCGTEKLSFILTANVIQKKVPCRKSDKQSDNNIKIFISL